MLLKLASFLIILFTTSIAFGQTPTPSPDRYTIKGDVEYNAAAKSGSTERPKQISGGVLNGKAIYLPKPAYPPAAKAVHAAGAVSVQVLIDENGTVVSAAAVSGHPLLRATSVAAARATTFSSTFLSGQPVQVSGVLVFHFAGYPNWSSVARSLGSAENGDFDKIRLEALMYELPEGFEFERDELSLYLKGISDKSTTIKPKSDITRIIDSIHSKLSAESDELSNFELRIAVERIKGNLNDDSILRTNLLKLRDLSSEVDENSGWASDLNLKKLAEFALLSTFTKADRDEIFRLVIGL